MMKNLAIFLTCLAIPGLSYSADFGVGGAIGSSTDIRLPIKIEGLILEPFASYYSYESDQGRTSDYSRTNQGIGIGIWKTVDSGENMYFQLGLQVGYQEQENEYRSFSSVIDSSSSDLNGYQIAPGFGLFYTLNEKVEIGLELKYKYQKVEGDDEVAVLDSEADFFYLSDRETSETTSNLQTQAVLRLYL